MFSIVKIKQLIKYEKYICKINYNDMLYMNMCIDM